MENHSGAPLPHSESIRFINKLENNLKRKAKNLKLKKDISYMDALRLVRKELGLQNYEFNIWRKKIEDRATFFGNQCQRKRCALQEKPDIDMNYYIFSAELGIEQNPEVSEVNAYLEPTTFRTLRSSWVGYTDEKMNVELRVASFTNAEARIEAHRDLHKSTLYVINNLEDFYLWFLAWGGAALIREDIVVNDHFLSGWLTPYENTPGWN